MGVDGTVGPARQDILAFVARRLLAEQIALVFALREDNPELDLAGLPQLEVRGLGELDDRTLLDSVIKGPLGSRVHDRIVAETHGNPLELLVSVDAGAPAVVRDAEVERLRGQIASAHASNCATPAWLIRSARPRCSGAPARRRPA